MPELIRVAQLYKRYGDSIAPVEVLRNVNLSIDAGEFVAITGPSGSGKSTFMNILGCLDTPSSGAYYFEGRDTAQLDGNELAALRNRRFGFVFQGFNLLQRVTALDNVALPLLYSGAGRAERRTRGLELLREVGLEAQALRHPNQLSGGQQQRVAIARALSNRPHLVLADEPTGNLDTQTSREIMAIFERLNRERDITIVLVTHETDIARYARRMIRFVDGKVEHDGPVRDSV